MKASQLVKAAWVAPSLRAPASTPAGIAPEQRHIALLIDDLGGGGVQRVAVTLAGGFVERGYRVDLVVCRETGPLRRCVPDGVDIVELEAAGYGFERLYALAADPASARALLHPVLLRWKAPRDLEYLPSLARYLKAAQPDALLAATPCLNLQAVWARSLARAPRTRILVSEHHDLSFRIRNKPRQRALLPLIRRTYVMADAIVAVSVALGDDLASVTGIPRDSITTIHNPVVHPGLPGKACERIQHPWFTPGAPPVVLSVGRLVMVKDFPALIHAFARVRALRQAKLMILGEGKDASDTARRRADLLGLAARLGMADDVDLPGFLPNPLAYMARAAVFVLSSTWEGFGNVLVEALACGCPVVSTDCPSGPAEVLGHGRYGRLVPVGDDAAMAAAILATLDAPPDPSMLRARARMFSVDQALDRYLELSLGTVGAAMPRPESPRA